MVKESIDEEVAKKVDLERVETSLRIDIRGLRTDMESMEIRLNTKIDNLESGLKSEISELRSDMKIQHKDLLLYLGGLMVTLSGIVTGVLIVKKVPASAVPPSPDSSLPNYKPIFPKMTPSIDLLGLR